MCRSPAALEQGRWCPAGPSLVGVWELTATRCCSKRRQRLGSVEGEGLACSGLGCSCGYVKDCGYDQGQRQSRAEAAHKAEAAYRAEAEHKAEAAHKADAACVGRPAACFRSTQAAKWAAAALGHWRASPAGWHGLTAVVVQAAGWLTEPAAACLDELAAGWPAESKKEWLVSG